MNDNGFWLNRRELLSSALTVGAAAALFPSAASATEQQDSEFQIIDTNVSLFQWPFRRLPLDTTARLVAKLRALGIGQAWAGSFESMLHRDIASVNQRLAEECAWHPELVAIGAVNLDLPGWENDLRQCIEFHKMPGVRLHPNYHGYSLHTPQFRELLQTATSAGCFVQIAAAMEDPRTQHPRLQVTDVDLTPLLELLPKVPGARVQVLNARSTQPHLEKLSKTPGLFLDTARMDGTDTIPHLLQQLPGGSLLFGSHAPFLIPEAALIRTHESGLLRAAELQSLLAGNARAFREKG